MYTVYIFKSEVVKKTYIGIAKNLVRRIKEHNSGKHFYTKRHCPWRVVYKEEVEDRERARKREKYLKSAAGRRFLKKFVFKKWP